jgi:putative tryptophan/tyrosine transport system substrate-binding protein
MNPLRSRCSLILWALASCFFLGLLAHIVAPACAAEVSPKSRAVVAMITWRGQTEAERGFIDGLNEKIHAPSILTYDANQSLSNLEGILERIGSRKVDLIYVFGTTATQFVLSRVKDVPVVFNIVSHPVASGIIAHWEQSGNNATGVSNRIAAHHQLKALKKVVDFQVLGVICNPREHNSVVQTQIVRELQPQVGFRLVELPIRDAADISGVLGNLKGRVDAVYIQPDSLIISLGRRIMALVNASSIPSLACTESMVPEDGALLALVPDYYQLGRMAAEKAAQILAGSDPSRIPSSYPDYFRMWVNMPTAKEINIQVPLSILMMADRIVR